MSKDQPGRLSGRRALITGASRGIGRAIAEAYAREGADLFLTATSEGNLADTHEAVAGHNGKVVCHGAEISDEAEVDAMFAAAVDTLGQVDIVVNNAGVYMGRPFAEYTAAEFDSVMKVNVYGVFHVMQRALRHMQEKGAGKIINMASTAGKWESPNQAAYNASKHAMVGITRCLALELAPYNILTNAICPWVVETDLADSFLSEHSAAAGVSAETLEQNLKNSVPIKRWIRPAEVANVAVFLASDESSYINGQSWSIDGGYTMI